MKRMRKRLIAFMLAVIMLFTTGCSSGFYADELSTKDSEAMILRGAKNTIKGIFQ